MPIELKSPVQSGFVTNLSAAATGPVFFFMETAKNPTGRTRTGLFRLPSGLATGHNRLRSRPGRLCSASRLAHICGNIIYTCIITLMTYKTQIGEQSKQRVN
jgi:hypothetical protein